MKLFHSGIVKSMFARSQVIQMCSGRENKKMDYIVMIKLDPAEKRTTRLFRYILPLFFFSFKLHFIKMKDFFKICLIICFVPIFTHLQHYAGHI